jgi:hypothetical protein
LGLVVATATGFFSFSVLAVSGSSFTADNFFLAKYFEVFPEIRDGMTVELRDTLGVTNADVTGDGLRIASAEAAAAIETMLCDLHRRFLLCKAVEELFSKRDLAFTMTANSYSQRCSAVASLVILRDDLVELELFEIIEYIIT